MSLIKSLLIASVVMLMPAAILAQTNFRWVGTISGDWNTSTNWLDDSTGAAVGTVPNSTNVSAVFRQSSSNNTLNLATGVSLQSMQFTATPSAYTIGGQGITFASGGSVSVASTVTTNQTINSNITVAGAFGITNSSATTGQTLTLGGTMILASNALTVNTTANTTLSGAITGVSTSSIVKSGTDTLTLSAANSAYAGSVTANAGTLNVSGSGTTGTGTVTVNSGGTLAGTGTVTGATTIGIGGTIRGDFGTGTGNLTLNGNTTLTGSASAGASASNIRTRLAISGGTITSNSKLSLSGSTTLNIDQVMGTGRAINVYLDNDAGLTNGQTYTVALATAGSNSQFLRNGANNNGANFVSTDTNLFSGSGLNTFTNVLLTRGTGTLDITFTSFTAVPEPSLMFGAAAGLFGLVAVRRKLVKRVV